MSQGIEISNPRNSNIVYILYNGYVIEYDKSSQCHEIYGVEEKFDEERSRQAVFNYIDSYVSEHDDLDSCYQIKPVLAMILNEIDEVLRVVDDLSTKECKEYYGFNVEKVSSLLADVRKKLNSN